MLMNDKNDEDSFFVCVLLAYILACEIINVNFSRKVYVQLSGQLSLS